MGRKPRNYFPGGIYHVIQRGHNRAFIFNEQEDKAVFLDQVKETIADLPCQVLFYVLMDNHYHFLIEMMTEPIDEIMRRINMSYCKYYNLKYHSSGTVYGGRYKSLLITEKAYLLQLIFYIANNPVKAGMVRRPREYRWCAHTELVAREPGIIAKRRLFEILGDSVEQGKDIYKAIILAPFNPEAAIRTQSDFIREGQIENLEILFRELLRQKSGLTAKAIRSTSRKQIIVKFRRAFTATALSKGYKPADIAAVLHITQRGIREFGGHPVSDTD